MTQSSADLTTATWRKASLSASKNECVEVAFLDGGSVAVRDSKNPEGPALVFTQAEWRALVGGVRKGEFDL